MVLNMTNILLIDDDDATNFFNQMIINKTGLVNHIDVARDGIDGMDFIQTDLNTINLDTHLVKQTIILLDINMPRMNGWEFLEEFDKLTVEEKSKYRISMLSTSQDPEERIRANNHKHLSTFLNKPLTVEKLQFLCDQVDIEQDARKQLVCACY